MIDGETAEQGISALAVAVAEIIEDVHDVAVTRQKTFREYGLLASDLRQAGADVAALAAAMEVIARRADTA
jgi:hypothetical protein